jgi:phospholipid/cholesterol/gamma-HCH transport system substrate-binding protein
MNKNLTRNLNLGLLVFAGLILFILGVYFIGDKQNMFGNTTKIYGLFSNVNGLKLGNNVRYAGLNVGTVKKIELKNDSLVFVQMVISNDAKPFIKKDGLVSIGSDGLVGNTIIDIFQGTAYSISIEDGDTLKAKKLVGTDDLLASLNVTTRNVELMSMEMVKIIQSINGGHGVVNTLLNDDKLSNNLKAAIAQLSLTAIRTSLMIGHMNTIIDKIDQPHTILDFAKDTTVAVQVHGIIKNFDQTSKDINKSVVNLNETITQIKSGKGAINYLSNDPQLVVKIDASMRMVDSTLLHLNDASIKLNENLEALKSNFLFRGYFKNKEKEKRKALENKNSSKE